MRHEIVHRADATDDLELLFLRLRRCRRRGRCWRLRTLGGAALGLRRGRLTRGRDNGVDRSLAGRRQFGLVALETLECVFAARLHARTIGDEIGTARCADRIALRLARLLRHCLGDDTNDARRRDQNRREESQHEKRPLNLSNSDSDNEN